VRLGGFYIPRPMVDDPEAEPPGQRDLRVLIDALRALQPGERLASRRRNRGGIDFITIDGGEAPPGWELHIYGGPDCTHDDRVLVDMPGEHKPWFARCNACRCWRRPAGSAGPDTGWRPPSEPEPPTA
jgi:hypothetical protein